MIRYKDFVTGKPKFTRGTFRKWTDPQGPLGVRYAIITLPRSELLIPAYCLTAESRAAEKCGSCAGTGDGR